MAYSNVFQPSWRFGQPRQFSYANAFQPSWAMGQPRQAPAPAAAPLPANSAQDALDPRTAFELDGAYTNSVNTADLNYGNTLAALAAQQPIMQRSFGYLDDGSIDPNNPFSKAQLLQRSYQQTKAGTGNSYAARGQLYSGALQRAQNENQFNYQAQDAQLRGSYAQQLAELANLRANATNTRNSAKNSAYWDLVDRRLAARNPDADPNAGGGEAPAPAPGPDGSFAGYQGTDVEAFLRALYGATQGVSGAGGVVAQIFANQPQSAGPPIPQPTTVTRRGRR